MGGDSRGQSGQRMGNSRKKALLVLRNAAVSEGLSHSLSREFDVESWSAVEASPIGRKVTEDHVNVIIVSQELEGVTGLEMMAEVSAACPEVIRILIIQPFDSADYRPALDDLIIHQYVVEPLRNDLFSDAIVQLFQLQELAELRCRKDGQSAE